MSIISKVLTTVFGRKSDKDLKKILPTVEKINEEYESLNKLSEDDLKLKFQKINKIINSCFFFVHFICFPMQIASALQAENETEIG